MVLRKLERLHNFQKDNILYIQKFKDFIPWTFYYFNVLYKIIVKLFICIIVEFYFYNIQDYRKKAYHMI